MTNTGNTATLTRWFTVVLCAILLACTALAEDAKPKAKAKAKAKPKAAKAKAAPVDDTPHPSTLSWDIRGKFSVDFGDMTLIYSIDNAEWTVRHDKLGTIINNVGMSIALADGSVVDVVQASRKKMDYQNLSGELGAYTRYFTDMMPQKGLEVHHHMDVLKERPFVLFQAEIVNVTDKPIDITQITPAIFEKGGITGLSADATIGMRHMTRRGGWITYEPAAAPRLVILDDRANKLFLALGIYPSETTGWSSCKLEGGQGKWHGRMVTDYGPAIRLEPGKSLMTPPVFLCFTAPTASQIDTYYSYALLALPKPKGTAPDAWVTVAADASPQALQQAAQDWVGTKVKHALVPATWTGNDGYPYDLRNAASVIKGLKMTPGLTVDPLGLKGAPDDATVAGPDSRRWLNPTLPQAREYVKTQLKAILDWGYGFFVVPRSSIPDEALKQMHLSRAHADTLAFEIVSEAVGELPVMPAAATTLGGDVNAWLEAAANTSRLSLYGRDAGPVALDVAKTGAPDEALAMAISFYGGPVELVGGSPNGKLKSLFPRPQTQVNAVDVEQQVPRIWQLRQKDRMSVVSFPGAGTWTESDLEPGTKGPIRSLRVEDGKVVEAAKK